MKNIYFFALLLLVSCGGGEQQSLPEPIAIAVDDLHADIKAEYINLNGMTVCGIPYQCGDVVAIDCQSNVDGPINYYNNLTGETIMLCGGACLAPNPNDPIACKSCPPDKWKCDNF
jgi:hypothetical protein